MKDTKILGGGRVRSSNIELFRILSMLMIVAHHYVMNSGLLECIDAQRNLSGQDYFLLLFGWGGKTGINCFVLITGYFMCTSNITWKKFCKLLGEVYFYNITIWCLFFFSGYEPFSIKGFLKIIFPFFTVADNFTACFLLFYLLIPFLNKLVHALTEKEHFLLLVWCMGVYVALPSFVMTSLKFNYITWFCVIYFVAAYIRLHPCKWMTNIKITLVIAIMSLGLSWLSIIAIAIMKRKIGIDLGSGYFFVMDCNKILAFITSISMFLCFKNINVKYNKRINTMAAATFGVFLIHANCDSMRRWLWSDLLNNVNAYESGNVVGHALISVIVVYIICSLVDILRIRLIEPIFIKSVIK